MSAVSASKVSIISTAFTRLGASPIASLGDQRVTDITGEEMFTIMHEARLSEFRWSFALRELRQGFIDLEVQSVVDEDFSDLFQFAYQKPVTNLETIGLLSEAEFTTSSNFLWTDDEEAHILYLKSVEISEVSASYALAMSIELSADFAKGVTDKDTAAANWLAKAKDQWAKARHTDSGTRTAMKLKYNRLLDQDARRRNLTNRSSLRP